MNDVDDVKERDEEHVMNGVDDVKERTWYE